FGLLAVAAWTSSISLLEPATAFLVEKHGIASRKRAAVGIAFLCWAIGLLSVLSLNVWSEVRILDRDIMTFIEFIANDLMLPLGGMLIALFVGWALNRTVLREQLAEMPEGLFLAWRWLMRIVAPALVMAVLLRALLA